MTRKRATGQAPARHDVQQLATQFALQAQEIVKQRAALAELAALRSTDIQGYLLRVAGLERENADCRAQIAALEREREVLLDLYVSIAQRLQPLANGKREKRDLRVFGVTNVRELVQSVARATDGEPGPTTKKVRRRLALLIYAMTLKKEEQPLGSTIEAIERGLIKALDASQISEWIAQDVQLRSKTPP